MVAHGCNGSLSADDDRKDLKKCYEAAVKALKEKHADPNESNLLIEA